MWNERLAMSRWLMGLGVMTGLMMPAYGAVFGGIDLGVTHDSNFIGAAGSVTPISDTMQSYSAYAGGYRPIEGGHGALVATVNLRVNRLSRYTNLDNDVMGGAVGLYHELGIGSLLASVGGQDIRYSQANQDFALYFARLRFKQGTAPIWVTENVEYDHAQGQQAVNAYRGYSVWAALNGRPWSSGVLSLSISRADDRYNVPVTPTRIAAIGTLAMLQQLGAGLYVRVSASRERTVVPGGPSFDATLYAVGLGMTFG